MNKTRIELALRFILIAMLAAFGANKFLHFMPMPEPPEEGGQFLGALMGAGYVFPAIGIVFLVAAVCLLTRRVALGLVLVAPVAVNIIGYHLAFDPAGIGAGAVLTFLLLGVAFMNCDDVCALFKSPGA